MKIITIISIISGLLICALPGEMSADMGCDDFVAKLTDKSIDDPPRATSFLKDAKNPARYTADKAFDGDLSTSWVPGKNTDGIGEKIGFRFSRMKKISLLPGYGTSDYFKANNRVKKAAFKVYEIATNNVTQCATTAVFGRMVKNLSLGFRDAMEMQTFFTGDIPENKTGYIGVIEILEVYRGERWRDTCIAEIKVIE